MAIISELSYRASVGEYIEIRVATGADVSGLQVETYDSASGGATLASTVAVSTGTKTTVGIYDYYLIPVPLDAGPRAGIALVENGVAIDSLAWGQANGSISFSGGALNGTSIPSVGNLQPNGATESIIPDGSGGWTTAAPTPGGPICLTAGAMIDTARGAVAIEDLAVGDLVRTAAHGLQPVRWIGRRAYDHKALSKNENLRPVRIMAGALGHGLPERDLCVSRQHRMVVSSRIAQRMFDSKDVLVAATRLTALPGIFVDHDASAVTYFHLLFDRHEVIFADGTPTESLFTGPEALKAVPAAARAEILAILPELADLDYRPQPALVIPAGKQQNALVARHLKNRVSVIAAQG